MLSRAVSIVLLSIFVALCAIAVTPVANVTSAESFQVGGVAVPVTGIPSWPLVSGDEVTTLTSAAVILFSDKSQVTVDSRSRVKLERQGEQTSLRLLDGGLSYRLAPRSRLKIIAAGRTISSAGGRQGALSVRGGRFIAPAANASAAPAVPPPPPPPSPTNP